MATVSASPLATAVQRIIPHRIIAWRRRSVLFLNSDRSVPTSPTPLLQGRRRCLILAVTKLGRYILKTKKFE